MNRAHGNVVHISQSAIGQLDCTNEKARIKLSSRPGRSAAEQDGGQTWVELVS